MKVLVCGSRDWTSPDLIRFYLRQLPQGTTVIHGDARGADRIAGTIAKALGFTVEVFPADWKRYGKMAGFHRNLEMLDEQPDRVLAFQRNGSRGTQHTIDNARRRGIPIEVFS